MGKSVYVRVNDEPDYTYIMGVSPHMGKEFKLVLTLSELTTRMNDAMDDDDGDLITLWARVISHVYGEYVATSAIVAIIEVCYE